MQDRVGSVYDQMCTKERARKAGATLIFLRHLRIYGIAYVMTYLQKMAVFQFMYIILSSLALIAFMGTNRPFASSSILWSELLNEFVNLVQICFLIC